MDPRQEYNQRWQFFYSITGCGMKIYNTYSRMIGAEMFAKYLQHLVCVQLKWPIERGAQVPLYWEGAPIGETCEIDLLIGGKIIVDIYVQDSIGEPERNRLKCRMTATQLPYGMIFNLEDKRQYCEWYSLDAEIGMIEKIKLL